MPFGAPGPRWTTRAWWSGYRRPLRTDRASGSPTRKYAFPGGQPRPGEKTCEIAVSAEWDSGSGVYTLTVADNGVGLPADLDWATTKTLGPRRVGLLGQYQLEGQIELNRARGTIFRLVFASRHKSKR